MFLSISDGDFLVNLSVKQPFAWDVRHLLTTVPVFSSDWWLLMMIYSRKFHSVSTQLPLAFPRDYWVCGELLPCMYYKNSLFINPLLLRKLLLQGKAENVNSTCQQQILSPRGFYTFTTILTRCQYCVGRQTLCACTEWNNVIFVSHHQAMTRIHRMHCWIGSAIVFACLNKNKRLVNFLQIVYSA